LQMYFNPQTLSIIPALSALVALGLGVNVLAIVAAVIALTLLAPWPAPGRAHIEKRGYMAGLYTHLLRGANIENYDKFLVDIFRDWLYYKMVWTQSRAQQIVSEIYHEMKDIEAAQNTSVVFKDVYQIFKHQ